MLYFTAFEAMKNLSLSRGASTPIANGMAGAAGCFIGHFSFSFSSLDLLFGTDCHARIQATESTISMLDMPCK
jgi:hypothetical protein